MRLAMHHHRYLTETDGIYWVHSSKLHYYFRSFLVDYLHHLIPRWIRVHDSRPTLLAHRHLRWTNFPRRHRALVRLCANVELDEDVGQGGDDCYSRCHATEMNYEDKRRIKLACHHLFRSLPTCRWAIVSSCLDAHRTVISNPEMSSRKWSIRNRNRSSPRSNWSMFSCLPRETARTCRRSAKEGRFLLVECIQTIRLKLNSIDCNVVCSL